MSEAVEGMQPIAELRLHASLEYPFTCAHCGAQVTAKGFDDDCRLVEAACMSCRSEYRVDYLASETSPGAWTVAITGVTPTNAPTV